MLKTTCQERFVLRRSRLQSGLKVLLALLALLAILAPTFDAPLSGGGFDEEYVSAPTDPRSDAAPLVSVIPSVADDLEEEDADQGGTIFLTLAALHCASGTEHRAGDARPASSPYLSANSCTGPPLL